jgi:hypothetical protein
MTSSKTSSKEGHEIDPFHGIKNSHYVPLISTDKDEQGDTNVDSFSTFINTFSCFPEFLIIGRRSSSDYSKIINT